jgi:hypothetical protein
VGRAQLINQLRENALNTFALFYRHFAVFFAQAEQPIGQIWHSITVLFAVSKLQKHCFAIF